jgi:phosphoglycolate phosphatase-like HAD superfamily hydrolase
MTSPAILAAVRTAPGNRLHIEMAEATAPLAPPDNWRWAAEPVPSGPAVIFDIDGVLSDAASRQHYLESPGRDWNAFFDACGEDPLIEEVDRLLDLLDPELAIILVTARPIRVQPQTLAWLDRYRMRWDLLVMRELGDYDTARHFKYQAVSDLRAYGFRLLLAFEDDRRNLEMFRGEGVPCLYIHSGYYD